jgi:superfamily II DNA helicase RecQ
MKDDRERNGALRKLDRVIEYCEQTECRRKFILNYFGEEYVFSESVDEDNNENSGRKSLRCKACDICLQPQEKFHKIKTAFEKCDGEKLKPVFDYLGEKYSYDEIKIAKLLLK